MRLAPLVAALALPLWAGTQIVDTLRYPFNGEVANCTLYIRGMSNVGTSNASSTFTPATLEYQVVNGTVNLTLAPNDTATPAGTSYLVQYNCKKGKSYSEVWVVPTSAAPLTIRAVRANAVPTPTTMFAPSQLQAGGAAPGQVLTWSGTSWGPADPTGGAGSGITSMNGLVGTSQTFATGTAGTDFTISSAGSVHTFNLPTVSATARGLVTPSLFGAWNTAAADVSAHVDRTDNPHMVTAAQVGSNIAQWNANQVQGRAVSSVAPADGQLMRWNATAGQWEPAKVRHTVTFTEATTVTVLGSEHQLGTTDLTVTCYDASTPPNVVEPGGWTVDPSTYNVSIQFAVPQSGKCVLR